MGLLILGRFTPMSAPETPEFWSNLTCGECSGVLSMDEYPESGDDLTCVEWSSVVSMDEYPKFEGGEILYGAEM